MSATAKTLQIVAIPMSRPLYERGASAMYSLATFIAANREALADWFMELRDIERTQDDCTFEEFCAVQYDLARAELEKWEHEASELRARAAHERDERSFELIYDRDTGIRRHGEI